MRQIKLKHHKSVDELEALYKTEKDAIKRIHLQAILLLSQGHQGKDVAKWTGYTAHWVYEIARRYNKYGIGGLSDRRHENTGAQRFLSEEQKANLRFEILYSSPPDGGLWTGPKVAKWIERTTGQKVYAVRGWEYFKHFGLSQKLPRPKHVKSSPKEQEDFKKN
jgi:transposase